MKTVAIYTNGKSLFTFENYDKAAGVSHVNGITLHDQVSKNKARAMHESGQLHYVLGMGDRKVLKGISLSRKMSFDQFEVC